MRVNRTALACLACLVATPALAATRYDVEVVIVEHDSGRNLTEERWPAKIAVPEFERARDFEGSTGEPLPEGFEQLPTADGRLGSAVRKLRESSRYRVLRHLHWRQPALEPGQSIPIRVRSGEPITIEAPPAVVDRPAPAAGNQSADRALEREKESAADEAAGESGSGGAGGQVVQDTDAGEGAGSAPRSGPYLAPQGPRLTTVSVQPLDGTIELVVSRYLHLHTDLYYTAPAEWDNTVMSVGAGGGMPGRDDSGDGEEATGTAAPIAAGAPRNMAVARGPDGQSMLSFPFRQSRRMRSGVLHYIDHPLLGLLVLVTPYEEQRESETAGD